MMAKIHGRKTRKSEADGKLENFKAVESGSKSFPWRLELRRESNRFDKGLRPNYLTKLFRPKRGSSSQYLYIILAYVHFHGSGGVNAPF